MAETQLITAHTFGDIGANHLLIVAAALGVYGAAACPWSERMLTTLFAARWLGHGRATECYLAAVALLYGSLLIFVPFAAYESKATADIAFSYGSLLGVPLIMKGMLSGFGLALNIIGHPSSRPLRFTGALLGTVIWTWITVKFAMIGAFASVGFPFCLVAALFSIRIMAMAWAGYPRDGDTGRLVAEVR